MNVGSPFLANAHAPGPMQPAQSTLDQPAPMAQASMAFNTEPGDALPDAAQM
jgi:hypothetical protein